MLARTSAIAVVALAAGLALSTPAHAQNALRDALNHRGYADGRRPQYPPVGRYVAAQGDGFVLDRSTGVPLLKFDNHSEVWALHPNAGPRGDTIYENDMGQAMVRATRLGGLILFTPDRPLGTPAAFDRAAPALRPRPLSPGQLLQSLAQASGRASRAARRLLPFEAPSISRGSEPLVADAAQLAADAIVSTAATPRGRAALSRVRRVRFTEGAAPLAVLNRDTLAIVVAPHRGLAGRPSSRRAAQALLEGR